MMMVLRSSARSRLLLLVFDILVDCVNSDVMILAQIFSVACLPFFHWKITFCFTRSCCLFLATGHLIVLRISNLLSLCQWSICTRNPLDLNQRYFDQPPHCSALTSKHRGSCCHSSVGAYRTISLYQSCFLDSSL